MRTLGWSARVALVALGLALSQGTASAAQPGWLDGTNAARAVGGLAPVGEDTAWSSASLEHSRYMARNGVMTHSQDPTLPGASAAGARAGASGNIARGYTSQHAVVEGWLSSPGHAYWLLNPAAARFGLGHASDEQGTDWWTMKVFESGAIERGVPARGGVLWPAQDARVPAVRTKLSGCGGDRERGGVAAYWRSTTAPTGATMHVDGVEVATCTTSPRDDWHVVAATAPTPVGADVEITLRGPDVPPTRSFTVVAGLDGAGAATRATPTPRPIDPACDDVEPEGFSDVGGLFADTVACVGGRGIADGFPDGTYRPRSTLRRGQTVAFVARMLEDAGLQRPARLGDAFPDDDGSMFERDADWLGSLGVLTSTTHDPSTVASRGFLAGLVHRGARAAGAPGRPGDTDWFGDDDAHPQQRAIAWAADRGIVLGTAAGRFSPDASVTRGQMSVFLARTLALLEA